MREENNKKFKKRLINKKTILKEDPVPFVVLELVALDARAAEAGPRVRVLALLLAVAPLLALVQV